MRTWILIVILSLSVILKAAYVYRMPYQLIQPDGRIVECFITGDEFFRTIHDENDFTIVQYPEDGFFYYAVKHNNELLPSKYIAGLDNPSKSGLVPGLRITPSEYRGIVRKYNEDGRQRIKPMNVSAVSSGVLTNIVVYVRFKGESEFAKSRHDFSKILESTSQASLYDYFDEVSYGKLKLKSVQYPECDSTVSVSYEDIYPRSYYRPYNATTNPDGYTNEDGDREQAMVKRAIDAISSQIPADILVDADGDRYVDNVTIVVKGNADGWGNLLWPHQWWLYKQTATLLGKRVGNYIFITENMYNVKTMCHEMFHVIGAPDLYHYSDNGIDPAGAWDLMQSGGGHPLAYMKWKYSNKSWIANIPEITQSGEYTLLDLTSATRNCFKIKSPYSSNEYVVVEYRRRKGLYESNLPQTGMLVYRINSFANGNAGGPPDEVYVYRPSGSVFVNGTVSAAAFGDLQGRSRFDFETNPRALLSDQTDIGVSISSIRIKADSVVFNVKFSPPVTQKKDWKVTVDSYESSAAFCPPSYLVDNNPSTIWHTPYSAGIPPFPHYIQIDFKKNVSFRGLKCLPRQDMENGRIKNAIVLVSKDGMKWVQVAASVFQNTKHEQIVGFPEQYCRFVRLVATSEVQGRAFASMAEIDVMLTNHYLSRKKWKIYSTSSSHSGYDAGLAIDSSAKTIWHTKYTAPVDAYPHHLTIDMNDTCSVDGLYYLPRQDNSTNGNIAGYRIFTSLDTVNWNMVAEGVWANTKTDKITRFEPTVCRYVKLEALSEVNKNAFANAAEIALTGTPTNDVVPPIAPENFRLFARNGNILKLAWERDSLDAGLLGYELKSTHTHKTYENSMEIEIDSTQNYVFKLRSYDSSGNYSETVEAVYNPSTLTTVVPVDLPIAFAANSTLVLRNVSDVVNVSMYAPTGQLISSFKLNADSEVVDVDYSGLLIVCLRMKDGRAIKYKLIF